MKKKHFYYWVLIAISMLVFWVLLYPKKLNEPAQPMQAPEKRSLEEPMPGKLPESPLNKHEYEHESPPDIPPGDPAPGDLPPGEPAPGDPPPGDLPPVGDPPPRGAPDDNPSFENDRE